MDDATSTGRGPGQPGRTVVRGSGPMLVAQASRRGGTRLDEGVVCDGSLHYLDALGILALDGRASDEPH